MMKSVKLKSVKLIGAALAACALMAGHGLRSAARSRPDRL